MAHMVFSCTEDSLICGRIGAQDYAGGTAVHINAGMAGLVLVVLLGKRIGFGKEADPPAQPDADHARRRPAVDGLVRLQRRLDRLRRRRRRGEHRPVLRPRPAAPSPTPRWPPWPRSSAGCSSSTSCTGRPPRWAPRPASSRAWSRSRPACWRGRHRGCGRDRRHRRRCLRLGRRPEVQARLRRLARRGRRPPGRRHHRHRPDRRLLHLRGRRRHRRPALRRRLRLAGRPGARCPRGDRLLRRAHRDHRPGHQVHDRPAPRRGGRGRGHRLRRARRVGVRHPHQRGGGGGSTGVLAAKTAPVTEGANA